MRQKEVLHNQAGFTLVEVLIVTVLFSLLMFAIMSILRDGQTHIHAIETKLSLETSARNGLTKMIEEVRESAPNRVTVNPSSLDFQVPQSVDTNGNITWSNNINYSIGGTGNNQLIRLEGSQTDVIANDIQTISFTSNDPTAPTMITVQLNLQRAAIDGHFYTEALTGQAKIRNE